MPINYTVSELEFILNAYKSLFPSTVGELANYWDYGRLREWSYMTTDFHQVSVETLQAFDIAVRQIDCRGVSHQALGEQFREISHQHGVGYSLGISPWTDELLLRTFSNTTTSVVIVLGHDWYPIITSDNKDGKLVCPTSPVQRCSISDDMTYKHGIPDSILQAKDCAVLFMNLYPDYRAPDKPKTGRIGDDYSQWVNGLAAVCESIVERFSLVIFSWGEHVWEALKGNVDAEWRRFTITNAVRRQYRSGCPIGLHLRGSRIDYYPFTHPSSSNFREQDHQVAYLDAFSTVVSLLSQS